MNFNHKIVGNERVIHAKLNDNLAKIIKSNLDKTFKIQIVYENEIKIVEFSCLYVEDKQECYVKFSVHRFVKEFKAVENLIKVIENFLRGDGIKH